MYVKWRFKRNHVTKVSAHTFARGYKKRVQPRKTLYRFDDFIDQIFYTDFEDDDFNCTGTFWYSQGNFQNTEAATGGLLKIQIKVSQNSQENNYASVSFLIKLQGLGLHLH